MALEIRLLCKRNEDGVTWRTAVSRGHDDFRVFIAGSRLKTLGAALLWLIERELES